MLPAPPPLLNFLKTSVGLNSFVLNVLLFIPIIIHFDTQIVPYLANGNPLKLASVFLLHDPINF